MMPDTDDLTAMSHESHGICFCGVIHCGRGHDCDSAAQHDDLCARLSWMAENRPDDEYAATLREAAAALVSRDQTIATLTAQIETARKTLFAASVPLGMTEAEFYRTVIGYAQRELTDDARAEGRNND
jgi:hypothetical protein